MPKMGKSDFNLKVQAILDSTKLDKDVERQLKKLQKDFDNFFKKKNEESKGSQQNTEKEIKLQERYNQKVKLSIEQLKKMESSSKAIFKEYSKGGKEAVDQTNRLKNKIQEVNQEMNKQLALGEKMDRATVDRLINQQKLASAELSSMQSSNVAGRQTTLGSIGDSLSKVAKFGAVTSIIGSFISVANQAVESVFKLNEAVTEFSKVSDYSGEKLEAYKNKMFSLGEEIGRTGQSMLEAATNFKKSGFTEEQSAILAKTANLYRNIADGEVSASEASELLTSQMKSFNIEAEDSIRIIDSINAVSNNFAVSSSALATSIPKVSATLGQAGNTMEQTIALITAGTEIMVGQSDRVARGLRSITLNLQGMTDEGEQDLQLVANMEKEFNKIGLTLKDTDGQMKSTFDILHDLSIAYKTLDDDTKNYYSALIGGKTQVDVVNSVLKNFNSALEANEVAVNSAGSAMKENEAYMDSYEAKVAKIQSQFAKWADQFAPLVGGALDVASGLMELENATGLVTVAVTGLGLALGVGTGGLTWVLTGLVAVLVGIPKLWDAMTTTMEEQQATVEELGEQYKTLKSELDSLYAKENRSAQDNLRIQTLEREIALNEKLMEIEQARLAQKIQEDMPKDLNKIVNEMDSLTESVKSYREAVERNPASNALQEELSMMEQNLIEQAIALNDYKEKILSLYQTATPQMKAFYDGLIEKIEDAESKFNDFVGVNDTVIQKTKEVEQTLDENRIKLTEVQNAIKTQIQIDEDFIDTLDNLESAIAKVTKGEALNHNEIMNLIKVHPELQDKIRQTNGVYTINREELEKLRAKHIETQQSIIEAQRAEAQAVVDATTAKIKAMQAELEAIKTLNRAYGGTLKGQADALAGGFSPRDRFQRERQKALDEQIKLNKEAISTLEDLEIKELSLKVAVSNSSNAVSNYNKKAKESKSATDKLAKEAEKAKDRFERLKESIQAVHKTLNELRNVSLEEAFANLNALKMGDYSDPQEKKNLTLEEVEKVLNESKARMRAYYDEIGYLNSKNNQKITEAQKKELEKRLSILKESIAKEQSIVKDATSQIERIRTDAIKTYEDALKDWEKKVKDYADKELKEAKRVQEEKKKLISSQKEALEDLQDMVMDMIKEEKEAEIDALEETKKAEKDAVDDRKKAIQDLADAKKKALREEQEARDYAKTLKKKMKTVSDLEKRIAELQYDTSAKGIKERLELEAQLAEEREELEDIQYENSIEKQENAIDEQAKKEQDALDRSLQNKQDSLDKEIAKIKDFLSKEGLLRQEANKLIEQGGRELYEKLSKYNSEYVGMTEKELEDMYTLALDGLEEWGGGINSVSDAFDNMSDAIARAVEELERLSREEAYNDFISEGESKYEKPENPDKSESSVEKETEADKIRDIVKQMERNSKEWYDASSEEKDRLAKENERLAKKIGAWKSQKDGNWYVNINGKPYNINNGDAGNVRHTGIDHKDGAFIGGRSMLKSNEEFIKAMKGEIVANPQQMDTFMSKHLPDMIRSASDVVNNSSSLNIESLVTIYGNISNDNLTQVKETINNGIGKLAQHMKSNGYRVGAKGLSI